MSTWSYEKHQLVFKKPATTSRGSLKKHDVYLIKKQNKLQGKTGIGECSPLPGLSLDDTDLLEQKIIETLELLNGGATIDILHLNQWPALNFAIDTALLSFENGKQLFSTPFYNAKKGIPVNGLVWMGDKDEMLNEAFLKAESGFSCMKFKIGALDFEKEYDMLALFREKYPVIEIRLDANGAFGPDEAMEKLNRLSKFGFHSIEQPIKPREWEFLSEIIAASPIPVALDEELIGVDVNAYGDVLMEALKPNFLVLKPTLLGGLAVCDKWIALCTKYDVGWWATSALESNIGLNAIAQWASTYPLTLAQGFGTGMLFEQNFDSDLYISQGEMWMKPQA